MAPQPPDSPTTDRPDRRIEVTYTGRVQGVGFRQTSRRIARGYPVTGTVRNLPNGSVHLVVEGAEETIEAFLAALERRMADLIAERRAGRSNATGEFDAFEILF